MTDAGRLELRGISKRFGRIVALDGVDFALRAGEIHALMGENGAGKSTLLKCLAGAHRPDAGTMHLDGTAIAPRSPREAEALGVSTVFQEVNLVPHFSVAENVCLGRAPGRRGLRWLIDWRATERRAAAALSRLGVDVDPSRELASCSIAVQQLVAIARALDVRCRVLVLDEPTSSLDRDEVERLFARLRTLRAEGLGIVLVTHFLDQVDAIADRVTVLRDGRLVGVREAATLDRAELVSMMVGRAFDATVGAPKAASPVGTTKPSGAAAAPPRLRARGLARRGAVEHADLTVRAGETTGLAGLLGSGRTETARLLFGADAPDGGTIELDGAAVRLRAPRDAIARGVAFTPEDRTRDGLLLGLSVRDNVELALRARRGPGASAAALRGLAERLIAALRIRTAGPDAPVSSLSGGNRQKVLLARWLATQPRLLILDEPTRGIDVAAKAEVLAEIDRLRRDGLAVLFISSELDEVVRLCTCVVVLRDRRTVAELAGDDVTEARVLGAVAGG